MPASQCASPPHQRSPRRWIQPPTRQSKQIHPCASLLPRAPHLCRLAPASKRLCPCLSADHTAPSHHIPCHPIPFPAIPAQPNQIVVCPCPCRCPRPSPAAHAHHWFGMEQGNCDLPPLSFVTPFAPTRPLTIRVSLRRLAPHAMPYNALKIHSGHTRPPHASFLPVPVPDPHSRPFQARPGQARHIQVPQPIQITCMPALCPWACLATPVYVYTPPDLA